MIYFKLFETILYIETYYDTYLSTYILSGIADMSEENYIRAFKQLYNMTPKQYILECRLRNACNYLITTDYTILKISILCGFDDLSYFYRAFKKIYGMTPNTFKCRQIQKSMV